VNKINFKDLINNYDQNLLDNLRGFGKEDEYLKFWVPNTDNYQSFLNLIDALIESEIYLFQITFDKRLEGELSLDEVDRFLSDISTFTKNKDIYEIAINEKKYLDYKKRNKKNLKNSTQLKIDTTKIAKIEKNKENLISGYRENLLKFSPKNYYFQGKNKQENIYEEKFNDIFLYFKIEKNILVECYHNSEKNTEVEKLINIFFDLIINKDIQEIADHGVIYLEEKIRTLSNIKVNSGIILPQQAGEYFNLLNNVVRKIFIKYKDKNKLVFDINRNYFKISNEWKNLPEDQKLIKIKKVLEDFIKENSNLSPESISVNKIENNFRINLDVDKDFSKLQSKKNLLLEIEKKLKTLDQTIEVFIEEILDKNKLRLKNSPQKI
jgi:hypothetical protein